MGIILEIEDYDSMFHQSKRLPLIVNDVPDAGEEKKKFENSILTKLNPDLLSNVPSCECGKYATHGDLGIVCEVCNTAVTPSVDSELDPIVWVRAPEGVVGIIPPVIFAVIDDCFTKSGFSVIRWLCDPRYKPEVKIPEYLMLIEQFGHIRSYNYFVTNIFKIIDDLISTKLFIKGIDELHLRQFLEVFADKICSKYMPLINKTLMVLEVNNGSSFMDMTLSLAFDAIHTMVGIDRPGSNYSVKDKEIRTIRTIAKLSDFYLNYIRTSVSPKPALARKHIYGSRSHYAWRSVISSITGVHESDEIHIPWSVAVIVLRQHLVNKLYKLGFTPRHAAAYLTKHVRNYSELLDKLFQELIAETDNSEVYIHDPGRKGIMATLLRNPSLQIGSNMLMRISRVKTDLNDPTTSIPILSCVNLNADFDGDACMFTLALDCFTAAKLRTMLIYRTAFDLTQHRGISGNLALPKPVIANLANAMMKEDACVSSAGV